MTIGRPSATQPTPKATHCRLFAYSSSAEPCGTMTLFGLAVPPSFAFIATPIA